MVALPICQGTNSKDGGYRRRIPPSKIAAISNQKDVVQT
jgi:hypothetical protein